MPVRMEMLPPTANPNVTAGFKWPPEILAAMDTPTKSAKAWATATATSPGGSKAASDVSLPIQIKDTHKIILIQYQISSYKLNQLIIYCPSKYLSRMNKILFVTFVLTLN